MLKARLFQRGHLVAIVWMILRLWVMGLGSVWRPIETVVSHTAWLLCKKCPIEICYYLTKKHHWESLRIELKSGTIFARVLTSWVNLEKRVLHCLIPGLKSHCWDLSELHPSSHRDPKSQRNLDWYAADSKRLGMPTQTSLVMESKTFHHQRWRKEDVSCHIQIKQYLSTNPSLQKI